MTTTVPLEPNNDIALLFQNVDPASKRLSN
jgi:hypothetical protein